MKEIAFTLLLYISGVPFGQITRSIYHGTAQVTSQKYASDRRRTSFVSLMTIVTCQTSEGVAAYKGSSIGLIDGQVSDRIHTSIRLHPRPDAKLLSSATPVNVVSVSVLYVCMYIRWGLWRLPFGVCV